jgi:hypothetical protein
MAEKWTEKADKKLDDVLMNDGPLDAAMAAAGVEHTPGEWWNPPGSFKVMSAPTGQVQIARVTGMTHEEAIANVRLITNAPKLLKACKAVLHHLPHNWGDLVVDDEITLSISADVIDEIEDVIAKATKRGSAK